MLGVDLLNLQVIPIQHNMYYQLRAFKVVLKTLSFSWNCFACSILYFLLTYLYFNINNCQFQYDATRKSQGED